MRDMNRTSGTEPRDPFFARLGMSVQSDMDGAV